jgi:hypothetical protein
MVADVEGNIRPGHRLTARCGPAQNAGVPKVNRGAIALSFFQASVVQRRMLPLSSIVAMHAAGRDFRMNQSGGPAPDPGHMGVEQ